MPSIKSPYLLPLMLLLGLILGGAFTPSYTAPAMGVFTATLDGNDLPWLELVKESTVVVKSPIGHGSGVVVARSEDLAYIVTAAHVTVGSDFPGDLRLEVLIGDTDMFFEALLVGESPTNDLALLSVYDPCIHLVPIALAEGVPAYGDLVYAIGYPLDLFPCIVTVGRFDGVAEDGTIRYSCGTWFGNSGGPIVNKRGQLIGLCNWGWNRGDRPTTDLGGGESIEAILLFLKELGVN